MLEQPYSGIGHAEVAVAVKFQGRDAILGLRYQVHGQKPRRQRQLAALEDNAADQAALDSLRTESTDGFTVELTVPAALAPRTTETFRPTPTTHLGFALPGGTVPVEKLGHRRALLVLQLIVRHSQPPVEIAHRRSQLAQEVS